MATWCSSGTICRPQQRAPVHLSWARPLDSGLQPDPQTATSPAVTYLGSGPRLSHFNGYLCLQDNSRPSAWHAGLSCHLTPLTCPASCFTFCHSELILVRSPFHCFWALDHTAPLKCFFPFMSVGQTFIFFFLRLLPPRSFPRSPKVKPITQSLLLPTYMCPVYAPNITQPFLLQQF